MKQVGDNLGVSALNLQVGQDKIKITRKNIFKKCQTFSCNASSTRLDELSKILDHRKLLTKAPTERCSLRIAVGLITHKLWPLI